MCIFAHRFILVFIVFLIQQGDMKRMTSENGKLEMERLALRNEMLHSEMNGVAEDDEAAEASLYKRKYEWSLREMELLKTQLKQQQEDDLDQLLLIKKQLEKKVSIQFFLFLFYIYQDS